MRHGNQANVLKNAGFLLVLQMVNIAAPLVLIPYLTRTLGMDEFGSVMVALSMSFFAYIVTDYGFSMSATYAVSKNRDNPEAVQKTISRVLSAKIPLVIFAVSVIFAISWIPSYRPHQEVFWAVIPAVIAQAYQPLWLFHGLEEMKLYTAYMAFTKLLYLALVLLLVKQHGDGSVVLLCWSFAQFVGAMVSARMLYAKGYRMALSSLSDALSELKESGGYFSSQFAVALYTAASSFFVGLTSLTQAALFSSSEQFYKAGQAVTIPIRQALYPHMAKEKNWVLFYKVLPVMLSILLLGSLIVYLWREVFIEIIFGPSYVGASPVLTVFLITLIVNYIGTSFGYPACAAIDRPDIANRTVRYGAVFFLVCVGWLFYHESLSALTMASTILATELLVALMRVTLVLRYSKHVDVNH